MGVKERRKEVTQHHEEEKMSLKPQPIDPVPEETARIARVAYPKGNIYLQLRDAFGTIYEDEQFAELYPRRGQPTDRSMAFSVGKCHAIPRRII